MLQLCSCVVDPDIKCVLRGERGQRPVMVRPSLALAARIFEEKASTESRLQLELKELKARKLVKVIKGQ